jgi:hypothetical protein
MPVEPERLRHGRGQALLRRDFVGQAAQDDQLRWWHNRALHQTYGVAHGLQVEFELDGDVRIARVSPGLAYDCFGRELQLQDERRLPVPDTAQDVALVITYQADETPPCAPPPAGYCLAGRTPDAGITFRWLPPSAFTPHDGVELATTADVRNSAYASDAQMFAPKRTRAMTRPRTGRGATVPGETAWKSWVELAADDIILAGIQVEIDTSAAGFTAIPCYFAEITGSMWNSAVPLMLILPFTHIAEATKTGFTFRILAPWLYASYGFRTVEATALAAEPASSEGVHLVDAHEREIQLVSRAFTETTEPRFDNAILGLGRLTKLAVNWIGIQRQGDDLAAQQIGRRSV